MRKLFVLLVMMLGLNATASADLKVFACEPEWAALARELGGDKLHISTATTALQDPHHVQARPSLIARLRKADLLICTGADLEVGWLPVLLRRASNAGVQPGQPGYQACLRPRERFWDIPVPKIDSAFDNLLVPQPSWSPSTTQQLRKLVAAPYSAPNDWTPRSEAYFVFPLAQGTPGKQCGLAATGVYQPSLRYPWLAAKEGYNLLRGLFREHRVQGLVNRQKRQPFMAHPIEGSLTGAPYEPFDGNPIR